MRTNGMYVFSAPVAVLVVAGRVVFERNAA